MREVSIKEYCMLASEAWHVPLRTLLNRMYRNRDKRVWYPQNVRRLNSRVLFVRISDTFPPMPPQPLRGQPKKHEKTVDASPNSRY